MKPAALACATAALGLAACGDDSPPDTVTRTVTQTATTPARDTPGSDNRCPDVALDPDSGNGAFRITVDDVTCEEAAALLRSSSGLRSWSCRVVAEGQGERTTSCTKGTRQIVFVTES